MPLTDAQKEVIRGSNRRLAVFGLFRLDDPTPQEEEKLRLDVQERNKGRTRDELDLLFEDALARLRLRRHRFAKDADPTAGVFEHDPAAGDGALRYRDPVFKLDAESFFDQVRPELRFVGDADTITIADLTFQSFAVRTPADAQREGRPTKSMQILRNSHLLNKLGDIVPPAGGSGADAAEVAQQIGGKLFKEIVTNLDLVIGFDHPRFVAGLTRLVQVFMPAKANDKLAAGEQIDPSALQRWIERDVLLRGQLVKYLMGLEDDDADTRRELVATLGSIARSVDDPPFNLDEEVWARQVDAAIQALADLKAGLMNDAAETRGYLVQQAGTWVADLTRNGEYNFPHPDTGKAGDLIAVYRKAKEATDWVSRFARTEVLHSFLVCWAASKYKAHKSGDIRGAAQRMFEVGVQVKVGRRYAQSRRDVRGDLDAIDEQAAEFARTANAKAADHLAAVKERIKSYFLPANAYTRDDQLKRAARLFVTACQYAGGTIEVLHDRNKEFSDALNALQQHVLGFCSERRKAAAARSDQETKLSRTEVLVELKRKDPDRAGFIDKAFAGLPEETTARAVKDAYRSGFTAEVLGQFSVAYDANYAQILEEEKQLTHLFGLWCGAALEGKGEFAGLTNVVSMKTMSSETVTLNKPELLERQTRTVTARATAGKDRVESRLPTPMAERLGARAQAGPVAGRLVDGDQFVGPVEVAGERLSVARAPDTEAVRPSELTDAAGLKLVFDPDPAAPDAGPIEFALIDLKDVSVNELFPRTTPGGREAVGAAKDYDNLAARVESCHAKYAKKAAADAPFRRTLRAAKLAQIVLAAPRGKVNLDARDLSNGLGVMQELVEKLGDPDTPDNGYRNQPDAPETPEGQRLKGVNLSEFYPLADDDSFDMGKILAYHYKLCNNLRSVTKYLEEVRELRDFFAAVQDSDLEIEVVNRRLGDYAATAIPQADDLFFVRPPFAAYMTAQAAPPAGLRELANAFRQLAGNSSTPDFQLPLVVLAPGTGAAPSGINFPVIAADEVRLPDLDAVVGPSRIQSPPHLLWTAAALAGGGCRFGRAGSKVPLTLGEDLKSVGLPDWAAKTESVYAYLRKTWTHGSPQMTALSDQLLLLKWTNAALLLAIPFGDWPVWAKETLAQIYGPPGGAPADEEPAGQPAAVALYPVLFEGLPVGGPLEVEVRLAADGAPSPLNTVTVPDTNATLVVGGRAVTATWAPK